MNDKEKWHIISRYLYHGLSDLMKFYKNHPNVVTSEELMRLKLSLDIHRAKCMASSDFLMEQYQELMKSLSNSSECFEKQEWEQEQ